METDTETKLFAQRIQQAILDLKSKKQIPIVLRVIQELRDDVNYVYKHESFEKNLERCVAAGYFCQIPDRTASSASNDHRATLFDCDKYKAQRTFPVATRENVKEAAKTAVKELTEFRDSDYPGVNGDEVRDFISRTYTISLTPEDLAMRVRKILQELALNGDIVFRNRLYRLPESPEYSSIDSDSDTCDSILSVTVTSERSVSPFSPESSRPTLAPSRSCSVYSVQSNLPSETTDVPVKIVKQEDSSSSLSSADVEIDRADTSDNVPDLTKEPHCCERCKMTDTNIEHFNEHHNGLLLEEQSTFPIQARKARWFDVVQKGHRLHCEIVTCKAQPRSSSELYRHLKISHPGPETREVKHAQPETARVEIKKTVANAGGNRGKALSLLKPKGPIDKSKSNATKRERAPEDSHKPSAKQDQADSEEEKDSTRNKTRRSAPDERVAQPQDKRSKILEQIEEVQESKLQDDESPTEKKQRGRPRKNNAATVGDGKANQKNNTGKNSGKVKDKDSNIKARDWDRLYRCSINSESPEEQSKQPQGTTPDVVAMTKKDNRKRVFPSSDDEAVVDKPAEPPKTTGLVPVLKTTESSSPKAHKKVSVPVAPTASSAAVQRKAPNALPASKPELKEAGQQHAFEKAILKGKSNVGAKNTTFFQTELARIKAAKAAEEAMNSPIQPKKIDFDRKPASIAES